MLIAPVISFLVNTVVDANGWVVDFFSSSALSKSGLPAERQLALSDLFYESTHPRLGCGIWPLASYARKRRNQDDQRAPTVVSTAVGNIMYYYATEDMPKGKQIIFEVEKEWTSLESSPHTWVSYSSDSGLSNPLISSPESSDSYDSPDIPDDSDNTSDSDSYGSLDISDNTAISSNPDALLSRLAEADWEDF